jgi:hypothetical protein
MDKNLDLIWKKIDGQLSAEEKIEFEKYYQNNISFVKSYKQQLKLHDSLTGLPLQNAPESIVDNVILALDSKKSILEKYNAFSGLKIIIIGLVAVVSLAAMYILLVNNSAMLDNNPSFYTDALYKIRSLVIWPENIGQYFPYILTVVPVLVLIWIDHFFKSKSMHVRHFNFL